MYAMYTNKCTYPLCSMKIGLLKNRFQFICTWLLKALACSLVLNKIDAPIDWISWSGFYRQSVVRRMNTCFFPAEKMVEFDLLTNWIWNHFRFGWCVCTSAKVCQLEMIEVEWNFFKRAFDIDGHNCACRFVYTSKERKKSRNYLELIHWTCLLRRCDTQGAYS